MGRFTLDTTTEFLSGSCAHSLSADLPYPNNVAPPSGFHDCATVTENAFSKALEDAQDVIVYRDRSGPTWPLEEIWQDKTRKPMQVIDGYITPIIQEALARKRAGALANKEGTSEHLEENETLLDHLVHATEGEQMGILSLFPAFDVNTSYRSKNLER